MSLRSRLSLYLIGLLQLHVVVYSNASIVTPSRCANVRKPIKGFVKCGIERVNAMKGEARPLSDSGLSSKRTDVYTCTYSCNKGYQLNGPPVLECPIRSVIDNPTCEPVRCLPLAEQDHGSLFCSNGRFFGSDCRYSCDDLYVLDGSPIVTCSQTGKWIGETPKCKRGQCIPLPLLIHGSLSCTRGWDNGSLCFYSCHHGFLLTGGNYILTCRSNGFWRGDIPTCEKDTRSGTTLPPTRKPYTTPVTTNYTATTTGLTNTTTVPTNSSVLPTNSTTTTVTTNPSVTTGFETTTGNSSNELRTYGQFDADGGPANFAAQSSPVVGNIGNWDSGLNAAVTVSFVAVTIFLVVVGIGIFMVYHKGQSSEENYAQL